MDAVQEGTEGAGADAGPGHRWWVPARATVLVLVIGLVVTASLAASARAIQHSNEDRLLRQRAQSAGLILTARLPTITSPLSAAAEVAEATGGDAGQLRTYLSPQVGPTTATRFDYVSVWPAGGGGRPIFEIGTPLGGTGGDGAVARWLAGRPISSAAAQVRNLLRARVPGLGYAVASARPHHAYVVYAEVALPPDRLSRTHDDPTFASLDYALFLGTRERTSQLLTTSRAGLPHHGRRDFEVEPFAGTHVLVVAYARGNLGGTLMARLPWMIVLAGVAATLGFAQLAERLIRRGEVARQLAAENAGLYRDQRGVAETLQRSLLPRALPTFTDLEVGARYQPGVEGIEIGGDWYDVVEVTDDRTLLVVGDVSGRGLEAGAVMASLRYAIRAHATQGDRPGTILDKLGTVLHVVRDKHFATVLCIEVARADGTLRVANAGHPRPLLIDGQGSRFVDAPVGPPVGVAAGRPYAEHTLQVAAGSTVLMFTDGLFERKGEPIDVGMERVRAAATGVEGPLDALLSTVLTTMTGDRAADDTAILGVRWRG